MTFHIKIIWRSAEKLLLDIPEAMNYELSGGFCIVVLDNDKTLAFPADLIEVVEIVGRVND